MPPPVPPHLLHQRGGVPQEDEAMASMLMSWYTSGYHTGYYQVSSACFAELRKFLTLWSFSGDARHEGGQEVKADSELR